MRCIDGQAGRHGMVAAIPKCAEILFVVEMILITFGMYKAKATIQREDTLED